MTVVHSMDSLSKPTSPASVQTPSMKRSLNRNAIMQFTPPADDNSDWENDVRIQSFYEQTFCEVTMDERTENATTANHSPTTNSQNIDPNVHTPRALADGRRPVAIVNGNSRTVAKGRRRIAADQQAADTVKPNNAAPTRHDINCMFDAHVLPKEIHVRPFYSDRDDMLAHAARKEVGHNVLELTSNAIVDLEEYGGLTDVCNLAQTQQMLAGQVSKDAGRLLRNPRKALAPMRPVTIKPSGRVPMAPAINNWMSHSPIKVRRETAAAAAAATARVPPDTEDDTATLQTRAQRKCEQDAALHGILVNKSLTVSVRTKCGKKKTILKPAESEQNSDDDVICLDDPLSPSVGSVKQNGLY